MYETVIAPAIAVSSSPSVRRRRNLISAWAATVLGASGAQRSGHFLPA
jgi:hypothetical protein